MLLGVFLSLLGFWVILLKTSLGSAQGSLLALICGGHGVPGSDLGQLCVRRALYRCPAWPLQRGACRGENRLPRAGKAETEASGAELAGRAARAPEGAEEEFEAEK